MRREIDGLVKSQVERVLNELEVVKREEFDAVGMAGRAREENDRLLGRIAELERRLGGTAASAGPPRSRLPRLLRVQRRRPSRQPSPLGRRPANRV